MRLHLPKPSRRAIWILAAAVVVLAAGVAVTAQRTKPLTPYQRQLQRQVDTAAGAPVSGRDPAAQVQTSLSDAASKPAGHGRRVDKPAANVPDNHDHHHHDVDPSEVLPNPKTTGRTSGGCLLGYDKPGDNCVTVPAPGDALQPGRAPTRP